MQHSVGKKRACGYEKMEKRVPLVGHSMGLRSLTMDSLAFWALGRFCQVPGCTRSDMAMSSKNMCVISALISGNISLHCFRSCVRSCGSRSWPSRQI